MRSGATRLLSAVTSLSVVVLLLSACKTPPHELHGQNALRLLGQGEYDQAVQEALASLRYQPDYPVALNAVREAFPAAVSAHEGHIARLSASQERFKWDDIVVHLRSLLRLSDSLSRVSAARLVGYGIPLARTGVVGEAGPRDYAMRLRSALEEAARSHYEEAQRVSPNDPKEGVRQCDLVLEYNPEHEGAKQLREDCRRRAVRKVAFLPFEDKSARQGQYGALSETVLDSVVGDILNDRKTAQFVEISSRDALGQVMQETRFSYDNPQAVSELGKRAAVHEIVVGKITHVIYTPAQTNSRTLERKAKMWVDKGVTETVEATVTIYVRSSSASIRGSYQIVDVETARVRKAGACEGKAAFAAEWARYSGDERALTQEDRRLVSAQEREAPPEEEMVLGAARDLASSLGHSLREYFR
jgi:hypothetical protein